MEENYINILENSLEQKIKVLDEIKAVCEEQAEAVSDEDFKIEEFDPFIERKGELIERLEKLDEGFETLYERVSETLKENKDQYSSQIKHIQSMIGEITEKSNSIRVLEERNRTDLNNFFMKKKSEVREGRVSSKAAMNYYRSQRNTGVVESHFMDSKQ